MHPPPRKTNSKKISATCRAPVEIVKIYLLTPPLGGTPRSRSFISAPTPRRQHATKTRPGTNPEAVNVRLASCLLKWSRTSCLPWPRRGLEHRASEHESLVAGYHGSDSWAYQRISQWKQEIRREGAGSRCRVILPSYS